MKEWLEIRLSWLRKPYLVRQYTTYYETLEWVGDYLHLPTGSYTYHDLY